MENPPIFNRIMDKSQLFLIGGDWNMAGLWLTFHSILGMDKSSQLTNSVHHFFRGVGGEKPPIRQLIIINHHEPSLITRELFFSPRNSSWSFPKRDAFTGVGFWTGRSWMSVFLVMNWTFPALTATLGIAKWRNWFGYGTINTVIVDQLVNTLSYIITCQ